MIKTLLISIDPKLKIYIEEHNSEEKLQCITYANTTDPLDIMSKVCSSNPSLLLLDDDFIKPNSERLLTSIKKVNPKLSIIFLTSNTSVEFGRKINSIGVKYYLMKPFTESEFCEFIKSATKQIKEKDILTN